MREKMKRYSLTCPKCGGSENIFVDLSNPENLFCRDCQEELDIEEIRNFVNEWKQFLEDLDKMKAEENE